MGRLAGKGYKIILILILGFPIFHGTLAQVVESDERALLKVEDGISFSKDSLFLMNFRFRMQNRAGFNTLEGDDFQVNQFEMRVRRLRLRFDGFVGNPRLQYYIQLAFSRADLDLENALIAQPVRDAVLYYVVNENFYIGFGQAKLPGNRQRVISSGNLQFSDRSTANALYTIDRDFGLFLYQTIPSKSSSLLQLKGALTTGDGRNAPAINNGLAYTGRVEFLPFGKFLNNGDYSEGDLEFEIKPKLSIAMTYSANYKATRTGGQLGSELFAPRDMNTLIIDGMFKYAGWAILAEYFKRTSPDPITVNEQGDIRFVQEGVGINTQISRMLDRDKEIAFRFSKATPDTSIRQFQERVDEALLGFTKYVNGHRIKLQANIGYKWLEGLSSFENVGNSWTGMFQVEFGI
ncbi:porin [Cecembia calidifontis]|uniref:Phosphate-selective porin O/P n=1 Tax=Cecembia calidifontis TaxID=1187080 RepID=A0A4Q7PHX1_9BACT|nr:porin [Cecembia calidifontis]RZS98522.1 phosphate-selective porin O/P [Cecembia calidifontis]